MSKRSYIPERGDLVEMNFQPSAGREIDKRRPAIVLSPGSYNRKTGLCIAVPLTSDMSSGPFWIPLPEGHLQRASLILCDYAKSFDYRGRSVSFLEHLPKELIDRIVSTLLDILDPVD